MILRGNDRIPVGVLAATGAVGQRFVQLLADHPWFELREVTGSERGAGQRYGDAVTWRLPGDVPGSARDLIVRGADEELTAPIIFSALPAEVAGEIEARLAGAGHFVFSNARNHRMDPDVPLIVPEVNAHAIAGFAKKNIIANPNCSTAQMVVALKPLHDAATIKRVVVATYQSVSGAGKDGMDELFEQSRNIFVGQANEPVKFSKQIAFNVIPHIDDFLDDGSTKEEWKMVVETKKILDPKIRVSATCVRVPVFVGHSEAINIEFENELSAEDAQRILREAPGIMLIDKREDGGYVTPVECVGEYATFVSRVREDPTVDYGLSLWCVSDNLRKGAALNAVQIAEVLVARKLIRPKQRAA